MMKVHEQLTDVFRNVFDDDTIVIIPETTADDIEDGIHYLMLT